MTSAKAKNLVAAALTGQIAGLVMAVVVMAVFTLFLGKGPLFPVQVIGSVVYGALALNGFNLGAFLSGLVIHQFGPALFWGLVFGFLASRFRVETLPNALYLGLAVGALSMVDAYLLVPWVMNAVQGTDFWNQEVPLAWDWAAHLVYGATFALYPNIRHRVIRAVNSAH